MNIMLFCSFKKKNMYMLPPAPLGWTDAAATKQHDGDCLNIYSV